MRKFYLLAAIVMLVLVIAVVGLAIVAKSTDLATESVVSATQESEPDLAFLILYGSPECTAPCWLGIRPGVTTQADLENIVAATSDRFEDFECGPYSAYMTICNHRDPLLEVPMQLVVVNHVVSSITFAPATMLRSNEREIVGYPEIIEYRSRVSLSDVVDSLGSPSRYYAHVYPMTREGGIALSLTFFYEEGIRVESGRVLPSLAVAEAIASSQPGYNAEIGPDLPVVNIYFYQAESGIPDPFLSLMYEASLPWSGWDSVSVESRF